MENEKLEFPHVHYLLDEAERGQHGDNVHHTEKDVDAESMEKMLFHPEKQGEESKIDFRPDARVWHLYLEKAERDAKERAQVWGTSLDTLLIFAGLFAGVLAAFVIDAESDLSSNSQQQLLGDILEALQNVTVNQTFQISAPSMWVNALWKLSLLVTLLSAVMGVLAKAWLAKFIPVTTQHQADYKDALRRYRIDRQAQESYFEEIITLVPMLIQLAALLFFIGFIIQVYNEARSLGYMLISFFIFGGIFFLMISALPFLNSSSPFGTPLSDIFQWAKRKATRSRIGPTTANIDDDNEALAEILYTKLLKSPKPSHVDEAITEVALPTFKEKWVSYFCHRGVPELLARRFRQCAATKMDSVEQQVGTLGNHMRAFLHFVDYYEKQRPKDGIDTHASLVELSQTLHKCLESESPLCRWNSLPEPLRPLMFALRAQIMTLTPISASELESPQAHSYFLDFRPKEMQDRPWEMASRDLRSSHRLNFILATCRGLDLGKDNLKVTSSHILSLSLAKAVLAVRELGGGSEWDDTSKSDHRNVQALALEYLSKLYPVFISYWENAIEGALNRLTPTFRSEDLSDENPTMSSVSKSLLSALIIPKHSLRIHAIKMLKHEVPSLDPDHLSRLVDSATANIANMVVYEDQDVRDDGLRLLTDICESNKNMKQSIIDCFIGSIRTGLSSPENAFQFRTIAFLKAIYEDPDGPFYSSVTETIPDLINVALKGGTRAVRQAALLLARELCGDLSTEVKTSIFRYLEQGLESHDLNRSQTLDALIKLLNDVVNTSERPPFAFPWDTPAQFIEEVVPDLLEKIIQIAIFDGHSSSRGLAQQLLKRLTKDDRFNASLKYDAMKWLDLLDDSTSPTIRYSAVLVTEMFAMKLDLNTPILEKLVSLAVEDNDNNVRAAFLGLLTTVHTGTPAGSSKIAPKILEFREKISKESNRRICKSWISFLGDLVKDASFPEAIPIIFLILMRDKSPDTETMNLVSELQIPEAFAKNPKWFEPFVNSIPADLTISLREPSTSWTDTSTWIRILARLSKKFPGLREQAGTKAVFKSVAKSIRDDMEDLGELAVDLQSRLRWDQRIIWVRIVTTMTEHLPKEFKNTPSLILHLAIHDNDSDVRYESLKGFVHLAREFHDQELFESFLRNIDMFIEKVDWRFRFSVTEMLGILGQAGLRPNEIVKRLQTIAENDADYDVRSEAINILAQLAENGLKEAMILTNENLAAGVEDKSWKVRVAWIKFAGIRAANISLEISQIVANAALEDTHEFVQTACSRVLSDLLHDDKRQDSNKLRDPMALALGKAFDSALRTPGSPGIGKHAISILDSLTRPRNEDKGELERHQIWIQIIQLLSRNAEFQALPKLIEKALKGGPDDPIFKSPDGPFQDVKLPVPIQTILPRSLVSTLRGKAQPEVCLATMKLLDRLINDKDSDNQHLYESLLDPNSDSEIALQLSEIALKDENSDLRMASFQVLKKAFETSTRFQDPIRMAWPKVIESSLKDRDSSKSRENAIEVIHRLTEVSKNIDRFRDIISVSVLQLLKIVIVDEGEKFRDRINDILYNNLAASITETKLNRDVLSAIHALVGNITGRGKGVVLHLAETLQIPDETAVSIVRTLTPMIRGEPSAFARETAIELISCLYSKHRISKPRLIEAAIPEIIALALDEENGVAGSRITSIRLLISLLTLPESEAAKSVTGNVLERLTNLADKFMALLNVKHLRSSVVELLSLLANETAIRRTISLHIISSAVGHDSYSLEGHIELLARLISDERFKDEPIDHVMLFLASTVVTRPRLARYQFEILTALWCRYRSRTTYRFDLVTHDALTTWFTFALFGRHVTSSAVATWKARCQLPPQKDHDADRPITASSS